MKNIVTRKIEKIKLRLEQNKLIADQYIPQGAVLFMRNPVRVTVANNAIQKDEVITSSIKVIDALGCYFNTNPLLDVKRRW